MTSLLSDEERLQPKSFGIGILLHLMLYSFNSFLKRPVRKGKVHFFPSSGANTQSKFKSAIIALKPCLETVSPSGLMI